ncbi:MAG: hypothetical protein AAFO69_21675, partial [Bacteroidota bacterium]
MNFKNTINQIGQFGLALMVLITFVACENDFDGGDDDPNTKPPSITSVSEVQEDVEVTQGVLEGTYILRGENLSSMISVSFNGQAAGFNPALLTDEIAFVKVPEETPLLDQSNVMRIETLGGVVEVDFPILHIEEFTETTRDGVKVVVLQGAGFDNDPKVTFVSGSEALGNLVERAATVVSVSDTEIVAEVPSGITQAFIFVETSRGAIAQSASYGFVLAAYLDELNTDFAVEGWGGDEDYASTEVALGETSIKKTYQQWAGLKWRIGSPISTRDFSTMVIKIYGGTNASRLRISFNDLNNNDIGYVVEVKEGEWNSFSLPLKDEQFWDGAPQDEVSVI